MKSEYTDSTAAADMAATKEEHHAPSASLEEMSEDLDYAGREPTPEEAATLRRVADHIPASAWLVVVVEFCERFTYYGLSGPFQNYIQYPYTDERGADHPGAIGKGQQTATALNYFFQ
ncbi:peptide transporter ptr2, partial [Linnemannia gamsii]